MQTEDKKSFPKNKEDQVKKKENAKSFRLIN